MKKVYIAGPITGNPSYKEEFAAVAEKLRDIGLEPVNPADAPDGLTYREYIDRGLERLKGCDIICCMSEMLKDNRPRPLKSKGARLELQYAITVGMPAILAWRDTEYTTKGKRVEWIVEIPRCWQGMFGEASEE